MTNRIPGEGSPEADSWAVRQYAADSAHALSLHTTLFDAADRAWAEAENDPTSTPYYAVYVGPTVGAVPAEGVMVQVYSGGAPALYWRTLKGAPSLSFRDGKPATLGETRLIPAHLTADERWCMAHHAAVVWRKDPSSTNGASRWFARLTVADGSRSWVALDPTLSRASETFARTEAQKMVERTIRAAQRDALAKKEE